VSDPLPEKGRLRLFGCGPAGRHALVRLDRDASAANEALRAASRGDLVSIDSATPASDGLRVPGSAQVTVVSRRG
jgi:hypothetical protein